MHHLLFQELLNQSNVAQHKETLVLKIMHLKQCMLKV